MDEDRPPVDPSGHHQPRGNLPLGPPPDATSQVRRARRRYTWRLAVAVGAILAALFVLFIVVHNATSSRTLAVRTFFPKGGGVIAVRIIERGDRVSGRIEVSGMGPPGTMVTSVDFPPIARPSRRARVSYDEGASEVRMEVEGTVITMGIVRQGGGIAFNPVTRPMPQPAVNP